MTDNKYIDAFKRMLTMTLALIMVLGAVIPVATQEASAFDGKKGSKYTVYDGGQIVYGSGSGGYSNSRKCDLGDDLGSRYSYCVQPAKLSPGTGTVTVDKVVTDDNDTGKWNALRNIVYYSPSYPGYDKNITNIKSKYYTGDFSKDWGIAHLALSYVYDGRPSDMATLVALMHLTSVKYGPRQRSSAMSCIKQIQKEMLQCQQASRCSSAICPEFRI